MGKELNVAVRKRSSATTIGLKDASGTRQVTIENFDPYSFARAITARKESRGSTSKQRLVSKVTEDLRRRGIRV